MSERLWDFSVRFYAHPSVANRCLELQDRHAIDVPLMLFAVWAGLVRGRRLETPSLARCGLAVQAWHAQVVRRLREVRRVLLDRDVVEGVAGAADFRSTVKAVELESERLEIAHLERLIDEIDADEEPPSCELALHNLGLLLQSQAQPPIEDQVASSMFWAERLSSWREGPRMSGSP